MTLPYPALAVSPDQTSAAAHLDQLVANYESIEDGSAFGAGGVPGASLASDASWMEELGRSTLTPAGDTMTVNLTSTKKYMRIYIMALATGGTINGQLRCNNDSGTNYARRISDNGGADATNVSITSMAVDPATAALDFFSVIDVFNAIGQEKIIQIVTNNVGAAGAANAPNRSERVGKWANTVAQITRFDLVNAGTGDFAIGSEMIVLGHD